MENRPYPIMNPAAPDSLKSPLVISLVLRHKINGAYLITSRARKRIAFRHIFTLQRTTELVLNPGNPLAQKPFALSLSKRYLRFGKLTTNGCLFASFTKGLFGLNLCKLIRASISSIVNPVLYNGTALLHSGICSMSENLPAAPVTP